MSSPSSTRNAIPLSAWAWPYHAERPATSSIHLPQIRRDDRRLVTDHLVRPIGDHAALLHHHDALRHLGDNAHVVFDEHYRATARDLPDQRDGPAHVLEPHPGRRLVEQKEARLAREGDRELERPLLPVGEVARRTIGDGLEPDLAEQLASPRHEAPERASRRPEAKAEIRRGLKCEEHMLERG